MKARKLVKDNNTQKQNIVFFGSYGYNSKNVTDEMYLDKITDDGSNLLSDDFINAEEIDVNDTFYYNYINLNLFLDRVTATQITIENINLTTWYWTIQYNVFNKKTNENTVFQFTKDNNGETALQIPIDYIISAYPEDTYMLSNFILILSSKEDARSILASINYPQRESKLVYDKNKYNTSNPYTYVESQNFSYATGGEGVKNALIPRLSVIKGELWYKSSYGLPLMDKIKSKGIYDSIIVKYITDYPDVNNLEEFISTLEEHTYTFNCVIETIYGEKINLSNE